MLFFVNSSDGSASNVNDATTGDNASDSNDGQRPSTGNYDNIFSEINFTKLTTFRIIFPIFFLLISYSFWMIS